MWLILASTVFALTLGSSPAGAFEAYDQTLTLQGMAFRVQHWAAIPMIDFYYPLCYVRLRHFQTAFKNQDP
jgi:hypothetical protein